MTERHHDAFDRTVALNVGEAKLRRHCGALAPLSFGLAWLAPQGTWRVKVRFHPEEGAPVEIGEEMLDVFPSDELIATAMLLT